MRSRRWLALVCLAVMLLINPIFSVVALVVIFLTEVTSNTATATLLLPVMAALAEEDDEAIQILIARAEGVSGEKLAQSLGISVDALKMRVMRMRKRLRARLSELRGDR